MRDGAVVPASASVAVRGLLCGSPRPGRVLAAFPSAVYVAAGRDVVALVSADGVRLPNALVVAAGAAAAPWRGIAPGAAATVGDRQVDLGTVAARVGRWWDPRPRLGSVDPAVLAANVTAAAGMAGTCPRGSSELAFRTAAFAGACSAGHIGAAVTAAGRLTGLGDGLTPAGDDLLAGGLAGLHLFGQARGDLTGQRMRALAARLAGSLDVAARTTALSTALLRHAAVGEVAAPAARACQALAGRGPLQAAVAALRHVGHSSGDWLLRGLLIAARGCGAESRGSGGAGGLPRLRPGRPGVAE